MCHFKFRYKFSDLCRKRRRKKQTETSGETETEGEQAENFLSKAKRRVFLSLAARAICLCSNIEGSREGGVV
jgi:hypothetical protein